MRTESKKPAKLLADIKKRLQNLSEDTNEIKGGLYGLASVWMQYAGNYEDKEFSRLLIQTSNSLKASGEYLESNIGAIGELIDVIDIVKKSVG